MNAVEIRYKQIVTSLKEDNNVLSIINRKILEFLLANGDVIVDNVELAHVVFSVSSEDVITTGIKSKIVTSTLQGTLIGWRLYSENTSNLSVDILLNDSSITDSNYLELVNESESSSDDLSSWSNINIIISDEFKIEVVSNDVAENFILILIIEKNV